MEVHQHIALLHLAELHVHDVRDGVEPERARDLQRHRERDAGHGEGRAQRAALEVADHHHRAGADKTAQAQALHQRGLVGRRRGRHHGLRGPQPHHGSDGRPGAERGRTAGQQRRDHDQPGVGHVGQPVEAEHLVVQAEHALADQHAQAQPGQHAEPGDGEGELDVMPRNRAVGVAQRLERGDLAALRGHLAAEHHIEDEHGHREKDRRQHGAHHLELGQLVFHDLGRELLVAAHGADCAIGFEQAVHLGQHGRGRHARVQSQSHLVERSLHVEGLGHALRVDPPDAERLVVGRAALRGEHVFGRGHRAHQVHPLAFAVEDGVHGVAGVQAARHGETVAHQRFQRTVALGPAPALERERVQALAAGVGAHEVEPDEAPGDRRQHAGQVDLRVEHHVELDLGHAVERGEALAQMHRRALDAGEHIGQPVVAVEGVARPLQRLVHREHAHEAGHTDRHHHGNGGHLGAQALQVAPELDVDGLHAGVTSSARTPAASAHSRGFRRCDRRPGAARGRPSRRSARCA
ncbi:hypothetical protein FQZ97_642340 [compost metagenome]